LDILSRKIYKKKKEKIEEDFLVLLGGQGVVSTPLIQLSFLAIREFNTPFILYLGNWFRIFWPIRRVAVFHVFTSF